VAAVGRRGGAVVKRAFHSACETLLKMNLDSETVLAQ